MKIQKRPVHGVHSEGSCSFCDKGKLSNGGYGLSYPYDEVIQIEGDCIKVRICEDCLDKLKSINFKDLKLYGSINRDTIEL